jgi:hypothetical protein
LEYDKTPKIIAIDEWNDFYCPSKPYADKLILNQNNIIANIKNISKQYFLKNIKIFKTDRWSFFWSNKWY